MNKKGKRFTNESGYYNYVAYDMLIPGNLPNYVIFDEKVRTSGVASWPPWSGNKDKDILEGTTKKADTIRELAKKLDAEPDTLEETVSNYNINAAKGVDPEFGKTRDLDPIDSPPFYAFERIVGIHSTFGGLKINTRTQVIDVNGRVIKRLYAAGETAGGTMGYNYPTAGTAIQNVLCFGRIAGINAASGVTKRIRGWVEGIDIFKCSFFTHLVFFRFSFMELIKITYPSLITEILFAFA